MNERSKAEGMGSAIEREDVLARLLREAGPRPRVSEDRASRVREKVALEWRRQVQVRARVRRRRLLWTLAPLATAAALFATVSFFGRDRIVPRRSEIGRVDLLSGRGWNDTETRELTAGERLLSGARLRTDARSRMALSLRSGASMRLDVDSELLALSETSFVLERGAVYLDAGGAASVEVRTPFGIARDVGTRFEVRLHESSVELKVREGLVDFDVHAEPDDVETPLRAEAGDVVMVEASGEASRRKLAPSDPEWAWTFEVSPPFTLEGARLTEFLDWAARELGLELVYADDALAREAAAVRLEGSLEALSPAEALEAVVPATGLDFRLSEGKLSLLWGGAGAR